MPFREIWCSLYPLRSTRQREIDTPQGKASNLLHHRDLFIDELVNLPNHFNIQDGFGLTGHSWDGILASGFFECPSESASIHYKFAIQVEYMRIEYSEYEASHSRRSCDFIASRYVVELCPPPVSEFSQALSANRPLPVFRALVQR